MNTKLVESLVQVIESLTPEEQALLQQKLHLQKTALDLRRRLNSFETQYHWTSEDFYQQFQAGQLGDAVFH